MEMTISGQSGCYKEPQGAVGGVGREKVLLELGRCLKYRRRGVSWAALWVLRWEEVVSKLLNGIYSCVVLK